MHANLTIKYVYVASTFFFRDSIPLNTLSTVLSILRRYTQLLQYSLVHCKNIVAINNESKPACLVCHPATELLSTRDS